MRRNNTHKLRDISFAFYFGGNFVFRVLMHITNTYIIYLYIIISLPFVKKN